MTTAQDVIAQAAKWVGFVEAPVNRTPFGRWYGMDGQPYCAMALSYWTFHAGLPTPASTSKGYAYTPSGANWFKSRGRWGTTPRVGAHVFFRFSGDRIHHVGLVTGVNADGSIDTIEANTSSGSAGSQRDGGGVWRRRRSAGIVGYGYPDYSATGTVTVQSVTTPAPIEEDEEVLLLRYLDQVYQFSGGRLVHIPYPDRHLVPYIEQRYNLKIQQVSRDTILNYAGLDRHPNSVWIPPEPAK